MKRGIFRIFLFILLSSASLFGYTWPVPTSRRIGGAYGDYRGPTKWGFHTGIDIRGSQGDPVYAAEGGQVKVYPDYHEMAIKTPDHMFVYAHIQNPTDTDSVREGEKIAEIGPFANNYNHLHFGIFSLHWTPVVNPLFILSVYDNTSPTVEGIWFRNQDNITMYYQTSPPDIPDATLIYDRVDIIARVSDIIGDPADKRPGIYKIGYQIPEAPEGVTPITQTRWLVEFHGQLPPKDSLGVVYSEDAVCHSTQHELYYIVTNTGVDGSKCWNTKQRLGGSLNENARINKEARFKDGIYKVKIIAEDKNGNTDNTEDSKKKVLLDNFVPFVDTVIVKS